jgi:VanZ family protein
MMSPLDASSLPVRSQRWLWLRHAVTAALVLYWMILFTGTHLPVNLKPDVPGNDKLQHFFGYGGLAFLLGGVIVLQSGHPGKRRVLLIGALALLALYGPFDELTQLFVGRSCDLVDWLADIGGSAFGLAAIVMLVRIRRFGVAERRASLS